LTPLLPAALDALAVVAALSLATWAVSVARRDASLVDRMWPVFIAAAALACWRSLPAPGARGDLLLALVLAWALRLAAYITRRNWGHGEDRRYRAIRARHEPGFAWKSLYLVFGLQAVLAWLVAAPCLVGMASTRPLGALDAIGAALAAFGIAFEAIGDFQMARFQADAANRGQVHGPRPLALHAPPQLLRRGVPVVGARADRAVGVGTRRRLVPRVADRDDLPAPQGVRVALLEHDIGERRPAYRDYIARTPAFFPGPPRR
jgi:steroid 5-alpha reductase family enzyme